MKGDTPKVVLVLEDTESRIRWLCEIATSYGVKVVSTAVVKDFLSHCQVHADDDIRAFVFDHDLGGYLMPVSLQDPDGLDGVDAVEQMPSIAFASVPVLIWSSNDEEAPRMKKILSDRGFTTVERMPWYGDRDEIAAVLRRWFSRA